MKIYLVSACLIGLQTRYDGKIKQSTACTKAVAGAVCIPVCPEQLGGLPTPRVAADLVGGDGQDVLAGNARVITRNGEDVTRNFILGAKQVLKIARQNDVTKIFLKAGSPSCGLTPRIGVTAAPLESAGFEVVEME
jgi:uncharacterized protein YbbK (DUF523 family)